MNKRLKIVRRYTLLATFVCALLAPAVGAQSVHYPASTPIIRLVDTLQVSKLRRPPVSASTRALESKAFKWSTYTTLAPILAGGIVWKYDQDLDRTLPIALVCGAVIVGPSSGYFVAGCEERAITGILIRGATAGLTAVLARSVAESVQSDQFMDFSGMFAGLTIGAFGATVILVHAGYDFSQLKKVVREHEEKKAGAIVTVTPQLYGASNAPGLALNVRF